jgi:hypothetical protein
MSACRSPSESAKTISPSNMVFTGKMVRAIPRRPAGQLGGLHFRERALVATTTSVVLCTANPPPAPRFICSWVSAKSAPSGVVRAPARILPVAGSRTSPNALTTARLETITPPGSVTVNEPTPDFMACFMPRILPTVAPVPAPTEPSFTASSVAAAAAASPIAAVGRTSACRCRGRKNGRRHERHFRGAGVEPHALTFQIAPHAGRRFQPERAAAGQQNAVDLRGHVAGIEHRRLLGAAGGSADIDSAHRALRTENRGAAGDRLKVRNVAHANAGNIGEALHGWRSS